MNKKKTASKKNKRKIRVKKIFFMRHKSIHHFSKYVFKKIY